MLNVDLVTPQGAVLDNFQAQFVILPTVMGEITILPEHTDLISILGRGLISVGTDKKYVLYKGVVEVTEGKKVVIAAERISKIEELVLNDIKKEIADLEKIILTKEMSEQEQNDIMEKYADLNAGAQAF